jgi:hypothetical protein
MFFPLVECVVDQQQSLLKHIQNKSDLLVDFLVSFLYVLYNSDDDTVSKWVNNGKYNVIMPLSEILLVAVMLIRQHSDHSIKMKKTIAHIFLQIFENVIIERYLRIHAKKYLLQKPTETQQLSEEENEERSQVLEVFNKCVFLLLNLILSSPSHDTKTTLLFFEKHLSPFVSKFGKLFRSAETLNENQGDISTGTGLRGLLGEASPIAALSGGSWGSLFGGLLLHCAFPTALKTNPVICQSFNTLSSIFNRFIDEDLKKEEAKVENDDDEDENKGQEEPKEEITEADEIEFDVQDPTVIVGATLRKLVEHLFAEDSSNPPYYQTFFLTYRSFTTPLEVLFELRKILNKVVQEEKQDKTEKEKKLIRFIVLFKHWVNNHYIDMDSEFVASFLSFLDNDFASAIVSILPDKNIEKMLEPLVKALARRLLQVNLSKYIVTTGAVPTPKVPGRFTKQMLQGLAPAEFNLLEWDSLELARQCTLIDFELFKPLQFTELFYRPKKNENNVQGYLKKAPNVYAMTNRFNQMSTWIVTHILRQPDEHKRGAVIKKFLEMAERFKELKNYHALNMIVAGLGNNAIYRLRIWDQIPEAAEKRDVFAKLMAHPYNQLRIELEKAEPPAVPFLGMFLTEIEFNEQNSKYREAQKGVRKLRLINFKRCLLNVKSIQRMREKQQKYYEFEPIPFLIRNLTKEIFGNLLSNDEAFELSLQINPRKES